MEALGDMTSRENYEKILKLKPDIERFLSKGFPMLVFSHDLEKKFIADTFESNRKRFVYLGIISIFLYNIFLLTDMKMLPDVYLTAWKIRLGIVTPALIVITAIIWQRWFTSLLNLIVSVIFFLTSASIVMILTLSIHPNVVHYHTGIILVTMFANIVIRLRFWYAFVLSWMTFVLYVTAVQFIGPMENAVRINTSIVIFAATVISLIANYQMENDLRKIFLRNLLKEMESMQLIYDKEELEKLSIMDVLTGLYNRRFFNDRMNSVWRTSIRYQKSISLIFLDVDYFKAYNDNYGHQAGDLCLQKLGSLLKKSVQRAHDISARYGGEEFVILLPDTTGENAVRIAEKIRATVESEHIPHRFSSVSDWVTVSLGVASVIPQTALNSNILIEWADKALYQAKAGGRNMVKLYMPESRFSDDEEQ